uniref:Protein SSX1-like n=1 Tax=Ictidomys tridecemlineatus TaxID=43179 RepID=I3NC32_ICTTR
AFRDISKYFSKKEWAKLSHSEKITYVYLKRNYTTMTSLGLRATLPAFMSSNRQIIESQSDDSDECRNRGSQDELPKSASGIRQRKRKEPRKKNVNIWSHRLRERKYLVAYEEISDPEEED